MALGFRRIHRHREKAPIAASVQRQEIHAVGCTGEHALPGMIAAVSVVCHPQKVLVAAEKRLDLLDAFGIRRRDHLRKLANPMTVEPMVNLLVVQFADIVREPFRLQGQKADEGGFASALPAHQHQHQLKLAAGMKHAIHRAEHERAQVLFVRVAHSRAKEMVQRHPDARHAIPDEAVQPVPYRMERLRGGHDVQRRINQLFRPQSVVFFQIQPQERSIHVVNHVAFPRPPDEAGHRHTLFEQISADVPGKNRIMGQRRDKVLQRIPHLAASGVGQLGLYRLVGGGHLVVRHRRRPVDFRLITHIFPSCNAYRAHASGCFFG